MPNVIGLTSDQALDRIASAGIVADVRVDAQARKKPLKLNGKALDPGQVHSQSIAAKTPVRSALGGSMPKIKLVVDAGKPGFAGCTAKSFTRELKNFDLDDSFELLKEKGCANRLNFDFRWAGSGDEPEISSASRDGRELKITVKLPWDASQYDLFPFHGQGAYLNSPKPSFGINDLALTADSDNVFGVRVYDRYVGDERETKGARRMIGAKIYVDGDRVGANDEQRVTREDINSQAIFSPFHPTKAGTVIYLVQGQDSTGKKIFGVGHFEVVARKGRFESISGEKWDVSYRGAILNTTGAARAAGIPEIWQAMQDLFRGGPLNALATVARSASEGLISLAKKGAGPVVFSIDGRSKGIGSPIVSGTGRVVSGGGANILAQNNANIIGHAGANLIGQAGGNIIGQNNANLIGAAGGNLTAIGRGLALGKDKVQSGTGFLRAVPLISDNGLGIVSDNGLGILSDNGLGLRSASQVLASSPSAPIRATSGGALMAGG
jgi:hypothetical protein